MDINIIKDSEFAPGLFTGKFGLEKECIRVDAKGKMAQTPHPFGNNPKISRDFSENQTEFITGVNSSPEAACSELLMLHKDAVKTLDTLPTGKEYFWPFSNPPMISKNAENPIARFDGEAEWKTEYRNYLKEKYGSKLMLFSGVHINFSFEDTWLKALYSKLGNSYESYTDYINDIYMRLVAWGTRYSWLIVYLFGASPVFHKSFFDSQEEIDNLKCSPSRDGAPCKTCGNPKDETIVSKYTTPRCSEIGYWNTFDPILDYSSLEKYISSINNYVETGTLSIPAELYYPIRIKSTGDFDMERLLEKGIDHIEFRIIDDNPYEPTGVCQKDIEFMHLLMIYFLFRHDSDFTPKKQVDALANMKKAALMDDSTLLSNGLSVKDNVHEILVKIKKFFNDAGFTENDCKYIDSAIEYQENKLLHGRYSDRVSDDFSTDYQKKGLQLAKNHAKKLLSEEWNQ